MHYKKQSHTATHGGGGLRPWHSMFCKRNVDYYSVIYYSVFYHTILYYI